MTNTRKQMLVFTCWGRGTPRCALNHIRIPRRPSGTTYTYPYRYVDSTAPGHFAAKPSGQDSPCTIEIYGPARNPRWELVKNGPEPQSVFLGDTPQGGTVDAPVELIGISSAIINKNLVTLPVPRPLRRVGAAQDKCSARVKSVYDKRIVLSSAGGFVFSNKAAADTPDFIEFMIQRQPLLLRRIGCSDMQNLHTVQRMRVCIPLTPTLAL